MTKTFEEFRVAYDALVEEGLALGYIDYNHDGAIEFENPSNKLERKRRATEYREQLKVEREAEFKKLWATAPNEPKEES
jgi:hypothetical protein